MLNPDEKQFEAYLKQFRPLDADPFRIEEDGRRRRRKLALAICAAAALALVLIATIVAHREYQRKLQQKSLRTAQTRELDGPQSLTIGRANELLARDPSFRSVLDELASRSRPVQLPRGTQSALNILGKENLKP